LASDQIGHHGCQCIVVAEADLFVGDGVVFVDPPGSHPF